MLRIKNEFIIYLIIFISFNFYFAGFNLTRFAKPGGADALKYSSLAKYSFKNRLSVHKLSVRTGIIYKLNAATGYVSVITLPVIPLDVALGNTAAFSEETVGRQIFVKPLTYDAGASSNLEIYTKYGLINILLRLRGPKYVTYNLDIADTLKNVFADNYIKNKIDKLKRALFKKYSSDMNSVNKKRKKLKEEEKYVMGLILLFNRLKIDKSVSRNGVTLTVISISRIKNIYYLRYQLTNNADRPFLVRNVYLYGEYGENFLNGYNPGKIREIPALNATPHNAEYMPYKIVRSVIVFKKPGLRAGSGLKLSFHLLIGKKPVKLKVNSILN